jgi:hypothetical protein
MKGNKVILIVQEVLMYVAQAPYLLALIFLFANVDVEGFVGISLIVGMISNLVIFPVVIVNAILAFIGIFKGLKSPIKTTMIVKLSLIPWYVVNFILGFCFFAAALNPFLLWSIPLVIGIMVCTTFMYMISTNFQVYSYVINKLIIREIRIDALLVWSIVLSFIFCLDIVSSILLFYSENKLNKTEGEA